MTAPETGRTTEARCEVCGIGPDNVGTLERAAHHVFHCDHFAGDYRCINFVRARQSADALWLTTDEPCPSGDTDCTVDCGSCKGTGWRVVGRRAPTAKAES